MKTTREILTGLPPSVLELIETGKADELGEMYEKGYSQLGMGSDSDDEDDSEETRARREAHRRAKVGFSPLFLRFSIGKCRKCPFFRAFD